MTPDLTIRFPDGGLERLQPKQHGILKFFADHAGGLVLKEELVGSVWGSDGNDAGHSVNQYVSRLRRLFARHGYGGDGIQSGYYVVVAGLEPRSQAQEKMWIIVDDQYVFCHKLLVRLVPCTAQHSVVSL